jgi:hypothetical protein
MFLLAAMVAAGLIAMSELASAQRPFRPNMYDRWGQMRRNNTRATFAPRIERAQPQRSFSVEPMEFKVGDKVRVTVASPLKRGSETLATVKAGDTHEVLRIRGPWVGIATTRDGEEVRGWVNHRALEASP